ncbi:MAG: YdcF family protein [Anaerotignum propionicum]|uniref:YdcF family protein n=1 Tax=Anaerotignum propionicum TaxID=28446 RepID=UPI002B1EA2FE|nr:YdcF family protein [Anaerotignum propionicum]MEA5056862.1 YdcF family protein [Anaerotignum propionicum]
MKRFIKSLFIILGLYLACDAFILSLVISFNIGVIATFMVGAVYFIYGFYYERIQLLSKKGVVKWLKNLFLIGNTIMISAILFIAVFGQIDTATYKEDAVIVLGAGLNGDKITLPLYYRLEKSIEYFNANPNTMIVVSGGQGRNETITEALAMERYLLSKGIPENKIIKEDNSTSTYENFLLSKKLLDTHFKNEYKSVFITNDFHLFRANELSKIVGINSNYLHAKIQWYIAPVNYIREVLALIKLIILKQ